MATASPLRHQSGASTKGAKHQQDNESAHGHGMLFRLFDSEFFDEFMALTYLHRPAKPGIHEYICKKLQSFPEDAIDRYLNQLCYLATESVPCAGDTIVEFCRKSLRIAVKVYWLLSALDQDRPEDAGVKQLKARAELAALSGSWRVPTWDMDKRHPPLPERARSGRGSHHRRPSDHPSENPSEQPSEPMDAAGGSAAASVSSRAHRRRVPSPEHSGSDTLDTWDAPRTAGSSPPSRPDTECGAAGPRRTPTWPTDAHRDEARRKMLGSTLDLVDALCEASIMLKDVPAARRNTALHAALQSIDLEIQQAHECGISVVFPMLGADERVLRVPHEESVLLGSREKAPYLLTVEVLTPQPERFLPTALTVAASRRASATSVGSSAEMHGHLVPPRPPLHPAEVPSVPETRELPAMPLAHVPSHGTYRKLFGEPPQHRRGEQAQAQAQSLRGEAMRRHREERMAQGTPMERALASLRDGAPAVAVSIEVVQECPRDAGGDGPAAKDSGLFFGLKRAIGLCSAPPSAGERGAVKERVVVEFKLNAGVDLEVRSPKRPSHARVPSMEALEMMRKSMTRKHAAPGMPKAAKRLTAPLSSFVKRSASKSTSSSSPSPSHAPSEHQRVDDMAVSHSSPSELAASATQGEVFKELWPHKYARLRRASPYGHLPNWSVRQVIVKAGDDCRQELMAVQLLCEFHDIWKEAGLPLYVRPYQVLVTSSHSALIEVIPDAMSIHTVKASMPGGASLADWFFQRWRRGTPECQRAQRNFCESMAAYSVIMYILQAKDRHNGNVMIDAEGHVVHIDFGFIISNSPGNVSFETAPFKLTREYLEVMDSDADGKPSEMFDYFKVLCIQGFLALRKHKDRIMVLVEVMKNAGLPCFKGGPRAIEAMHRRFNLGCTEDQCVQLVLQMISDSMDAWRTRQYDYYQRVLNGIL